MFFNGLSQKTPKKMLDKNSIGLDILVEEGDVHGLKAGISDLPKQLLDVLLRKTEDVGLI